MQNSESNPLRRISEYLLYPVLMAIGVVVSWLLSVSTVSQASWKRLATETLAFWGSVALLRMLEAVRPFEHAWTRADGQLMNDIVLGIFAPLSVNLLALPLFRLIDQT